MKSLLVLLMCSAMSLGAQAQEDQLPSFKEVVIGVNDVFVPAGFDSESDSYVVVSGIFPNGCYQWKEAKVKNVTTHSHEVVTTARVSQGMCIQVLIPYSKDVRLGKLATGKHNLRFLSGDGTYLEKSLVVQ